jgi:hypothetical protein
MEKRWYLDTRIVQILPAAGLKVLHYDSESGEPWLSECVCLALIEDYVKDEGAWDTIVAPMDCVDGALDRLDKDANYVGVYAMEAWQNAELMKELAKQDFDLSRKHKAKKE